MVGSTNQWQPQPQSSFVKQSPNVVAVNRTAALAVHPDLAAVGSKSSTTMSCFGFCTICRYVNYDVEERELYERSRYIEKQLSKERRQLRQEVKLLLLGKRKNWDLNDPNQSIDFFPLSLSRSGAGESGKSTFVKQMKIIHGYNFDSDHLIEYRQTIYSNIVKGMKVLIDARNKLHISWQNPENALFAAHVFSYQNQSLDPKLFSEYSDQIHFLWADAGIRETYDRRAEFQIVSFHTFLHFKWNEVFISQPTWFLFFASSQSDGVRYFFENLDRISFPGYMPTAQDILHARKATKGITEYSVEVNNVPFTFVDVGGQRSQRQKWFQCFDTVTSILFMVSSSEYDQVLLEDRITNRLTEAKLIFENIVNHRAFTDVSMILFLNKTDLLKEKLQKLTQSCRRGSTRADPPASNGIHSPSKRIEIRITNPEEQTKVWRDKTDMQPGSLPNQKPRPANEDGDEQPPEEAEDAAPRLATIADFFPEFSRDPLHLNDVQQFILDMFDKTRRDRRKMMYHHFTTAVDTENIKYVFNAVRSTILHKNITALMLQ